MHLLLGSFDSSLLLFNIISFMSFLISARLLSLSFISITGCGLPWYWSDILSKASVMDLRIDLALYFPSLMKQKRRKQKARAKRSVCKRARLFSSPGGHSLSGNEWILLQAESKQPPRNLLVIGYVQRGDVFTTKAPRSVRLSVPRSSTRRRRSFLKSNPL